jgi:hypothetical protein
MTDPRTSLLAAFLLGLSPVPLAAGIADRGAPSAISGAGVRAGEILHAARATTVRTRGSGNLLVDLPRGRALRVAAIRGETAILEPCPEDADLLRQFGVRRLPRYALPLARLRDEFVTPREWEKMRADALARIRGRWPDLDALRQERIFAGEPWPGMTREQAEEAVGGVLFSRETRAGSDGPEEVWRIGRRSRSAELVQFTEGRERGLKTRSFDEDLERKTRALLHFRGGLLVSIEPSTPGG